MNLKQMIKSLLDERAKLDLAIESLSALDKLGDVERPANIKVVHAVPEPEEPKRGAIIRKVLSVMGKRQRRCENIAQRAGFTVTQTSAALVRLRKHGKVVHGSTEYWWKLPNENAKTETHS